MSKSLKLTFVKFIIKIKLFSLKLTNWQNKLERFFPESIFRLV